MNQYIDIVNHVLNDGKEKRPVRKDSEGIFRPVDGGVMTLACPNVLFSHDMRNGFPLLTTKKMAWKTIRVELEGFIHGITDKKWYQERGCKIWDQWANPKAVEQAKKDSHSVDNWVGWSVEHRKELQAQVEDLGPIYGRQWRRFDETYPSQEEHEYGTGLDIFPNGVFRGTDQLGSIVHTLKNNPMDRRMVCSAWNPNQIDMMALPPCHYVWNVTVMDGEIHLFWAQRSCDLMLGVPFNIASYGLLLELLAKVSGLQAGNLSGMLVDCHIYENQIEAAREQVTRTPKDLPKITICNNTEYVPVRNEDFDLFRWNHEQVILKDYNSHSKIQFGDVVV